MPIDTLTEPTVGRLSFAKLRGFPQLFVDYCERFDAVASYFNGNPWDAGARGAAADRAAHFDRDRDLLVEVLREQNDRWGAGEATRLNVEALRDPETVVVVTGQQVGLFTGPLYTLYKALTAIRLAGSVASETGRKVVPVFWVPGEDHDLEEVASAVLLRNNEPLTLRYDGHTLPDDGNLGPVGRLVLDDHIDDVTAQLEETLPPTDFRPSLMRRVREAYRPGVNMADAFVHLLKALLPADNGLVFLSPDDVRLKRAVAPLFRKEIEDYATLHAGMSAVSEMLERQYHAQVHLQPTNLFLMDDGARRPIDADAGAFVLRGTDRRFSRQALLGLLDRHPEQLSPNVVLRPLMQDVLLPTTAYVAGPGELSYFAQLKPAYEWAGVPMPLIYPRASVTLVEAKVEKVLSKYDLALPDLAEDLDVVFKRLVMDRMEVDVDALFKESTRPLHQAVNSLKSGVEQVDATLGRSAEALRASLMKEVEKFKERVVRAEKRNHDEVRSQLDKVYTNLLPMGSLQERVLSPLYFLNKYGPAAVADLLDRLSLGTDTHQVVAW